MRDTSDVEEELRPHAEQFARARGWAVEGGLGSGGSAAVFQVRGPEGTMALKVYLPRFFSGDGASAERRRIELQRSLISQVCPTLVQLLEITFEQDTCFLLMEHVPWHDLSKCLANVPRTEIYSLLGQLVTAVRFLEEHNIVHRDIKPANILVSPDFKRLKLIDLGVIRDTSDVEDRGDGTDHGAKRPFIATNQYSSPEYLFRTQAPSRALWKALTIYQIGGVLHDLIVRRPLFSDEVATGNRYAVALAVQTKVPSLETDDAVEPELKRLASHCLAKDLHQRLALVEWEDFKAPDPEDLEGLRRRLAGLGVANARQSLLQQLALRQELKRKETLNRLANTFETRVMEDFPEALVELVVQESLVPRASLRFHLPHDGWAVDYCLTIDWNKTDGSGLPSDVVGAACLSRKTLASQFPESGTLVSTITSTGDGLEEGATALALDFRGYLHSALSVLEQGAPDASMYRLQGRGK